MKSFVIFSISDEYFGINIENVKRILPAQTLTKIANTQDHIQGMFEYEDKILKVISFRKIIGEPSYVQELKSLFPTLQCQHKEWLDCLVESVEKGTAFEKTTDPHACHLGKWIDSFHPENTEVVGLMKELTFFHQRLHYSAVDVLELAENSQEEALGWIHDNVKEIYGNTISYLSKVEDKSEEVAVDLQRCLVINNEDGSLIGVNIDAVEDIIHVEDSALHSASEAKNMGDYMKVEGVLDFKDSLVTIVKEIKVEKG